MLLRLPPLYPILDTGTVARCGMTPSRAAEQVLAGGARILQFRHKSHVSREVYVELERVAALCNAAGATLIVNDRADLACLSGGGLHLGQDDLPAEIARQLAGSDRIIGLSTHNERQLRAAGREPVDYVALGPIFPTASKQNPDPVVGLETLRRLRPLTQRPIVAIGGITRDNARDVLAAGADSVALISDLFPENGKIQARVAEWVQLLR